MNALNRLQQQQEEKELFESAIRSLQAEIANIGVYITIDAEARRAYSRQILAMASELRFQATSGVISWGEAATQAQETRNAIMSVIRSRSTPVGLALAERLKREGKTLNELIARKIMQLHGEGIRFDDLSPQQQNNIYAQIVESAGKSNPKVSSTMKKLSYAGRSLVFISIALSVYTVATAENKVEAAGRELAVTGAGITGGMAGGALAGLACGPGAPVCVTVGAFVGGALAAFGVSLAW
ncbi:hypothetical protein KDW99_07890 [Marinomonas rhizomae]|uniref:hypothetical protein n=1 Tax=Marinomonas rhizomae TaxID=491948 RepID=UPI002104749D|nr:hypothetical protein [Marinomonas rhizomae]UTW01034.1 hypothetical protein KDW99_07890 [Marinomonas rhizomae]